MTEPLLALTLDDLSTLPDLFPQFDFSRQEQVDALLLSTSGDIQAAPGSGKTSLLGAKLSLMAGRWTHSRRGICILTHTNVARAEIEHCLKSAPHGESLLGYPHYIGTIQSFINRFIALPWLRTLGIELREIDEEGFSDRFVRSAYRFCRAWVEASPYERKSTLRQIRYKGANLDLYSDADTPLPATGVMLRSLRELKDSMAREGRVRHVDMFAYALQALAQTPALADAVRYRFPSVFIDEMQDTSDIQSEVLDLLFDGHSTVQRFGDVNQSILNRTAGTASNAFPHAAGAEVCTSMRFGAHIAAVANNVKPVGSSIVGAGPTASAAPTLFFYSDETIQQVIPRFGAWVAGLASQEELDKLPVKAVCAIRTPGNQRQRVGRYIADYFPAFDDSAAKPARASQGMRQLLRTAASNELDAAARVSAARMSILKLVQEFGIESARSVRTWRELLDILGSDEDLRRTAASTVRRLVLDPEDMTAAESLLKVIHALMDDFGTVVQGRPSAEDVPEEWLADGAAPPMPHAQGRNSIIVEASDVRFPLHVATIASVKGETHLATLILESCRNKRFDVEDMLPYLCGTKSAVDTQDRVEMEQLMSMFVGVSRPRRILGVAMHIKRADIESVEALERLGWEFVDWSE